MSLQYCPKPESPTNTFLSPTSHSFLCSVLVTQACIFTHLRIQRENSGCVLVSKRLKALSVTVLIGLLLQAQVALATDRSCRCGGLPHLLPQSRFSFPE